VFQSICDYSRGNLLAGGRGGGRGRNHSRGGISTTYRLAVTHAFAVSQITHIGQEIPRLSAESAPLARHIRQCNTPSIERQYEAAYLSLFLLLSRAHFYERIRQPDYRWSLYDLRLRLFSLCLSSLLVFSPLPPLFLPFSLLILSTVLPCILFILPSSLFLSRLVTRMQKIEQRRSIRVKVKEPRQS